MTTASRLRDSDRADVLRSQLARLERINARQAGENKRRSAATIARLRQELAQDGSSDGT